MRRIDDKNYLTPNEVANLLGVHRRTVIRWISQDNDLLRKIKWFKDPLSGFTFFEEKSVILLKEQILQSKA